MIFTKYLRPNGVKQRVETTRPPEIEAMASALSAKGVKFEIEVLMNGLVSLTAEMDGELCSLAHEISPNGPEVCEAVDRLVRTTAERLS